MANEHKGDHDFKRPLLPERGLRFLQQLNPHGGFAQMRCAIAEQHEFAVGFYADQHGYGWELCKECAPIYAAAVQIEEVADVEVIAKTPDRHRPADPAVKEVREGAQKRGRVHGRGISLVR